MKRTIIFIISLSLLISSTIPVYADDISIGSAIKSIKAVSDTKAAGDTVDPVSSSGTRYTLASNGVTTATAIISKWADIVTHITYSFAYSADYIRTSINNIYSLMTSYFRSTNTTGYYYWDWTPTGGVNQGAPESTETVIQAIRNIGMQTTKSLAYVTEYTYQIYQNILNGLNLKVVDNPDNGFNQSYLWKRYENGSVGSFTTYRQLADGTSASATWGLTNHSALETIAYILTRYDNSFFQFASGMIKNWQNANVNLYNSDLTSYSMGTSGNSFWYDFRRAASNISMHLARLDYVLASDDEIEAREAAQDNQDAFVNDFLDSNGAGSASASDIGDMSGISSGVQDVLSTGVSPTSAFSSMGSDSSAWDWFKNDTKNALDTTSSNRRNIKSSDSDTPLLDNYYSDLQEKLKVYKK